MSEKLFNQKKKIFELRNNNNSNNTIKMKRNEKKEIKKLIKMIMEAIILKIF